MTRSIYIVGGAGSGKSTFMSRLLEMMGAELGDLIDIHAAPNARGTIVTLRGHEVAAARGSGLYIGCMRDSFPGTDGLDRASSSTGKVWLDSKPDLPSFIVSEGLTLATRPFLGALGERTDLMLVHLHADEWLTELRFGQRGSNQDPTFVKMSTTRSLNLYEEFVKAKRPAFDIDTEHRSDVENGLLVCLQHLELL